MIRQQIPVYILPVIVLAQFFGTSMWFAGNAVSSQLIIEWSLPLTATGYLTSSVQGGFIVGTLIFAILSVADRFHPSRLFLFCASLGALFNYLVNFSDGNFELLIFFRFSTGFFLAGIYPVGMKIAADWYEKKLGNALGFLLGALVLGTGLPHLLKVFPVFSDWKSVFQMTSILAVCGGVMMVLLVKEGPFRTKSTGFHPSYLLKAFRTENFRGAAFGYFGHMWELYTFWAFMPLFVAGLGLDSKTSSMYSFLIIAAGSIGCIAGGLISVRTGNARVAFTALAISGLCCLISPFLSDMPEAIVLAVLFLWGFTVVADSPQFSSLVAKTAPVTYKGSALTLVNSIGFALTIPSIELMNYLMKDGLNWNYWLLLVPGPVIGLGFILKSKILNPELKN